MAMKRTTFVAITIIMLMFAVPPGAHASWGDDTGKTPATDTKKDDSGTSAPAKKAAAAGAPGSAVESQLEELREELNAQKAMLEAQQARIAQLEGQLHAAPEQPVVAIAASASTSGPTVASNVSQPVAGGALPAASPAPQSGGTQKAGEQGAAPLTWKIGNAELTPGGWADILGIFRSSDIGSGTGTSFGAIPFNNQLPLASLSEFRATAQTSRLSMKIDANVTDSTSVRGYVESDFNGFQPPNAYTTTNSGSFRLRLAFADVKHGKWEVLGGQTWTLLTPNRVGLSPMPADVFTGYRLDTNYFAGLVYSRQAGFRLIYHPADWWSIGFSLENPQQYAPTSVVFPSAYFSGQFDNGSSATNGTGATTNPAIPNLHPDVIVKSAFDWKPGGHAFHLETAGLIRSFKVSNNLVTPSNTNAITEGSGAVNLNFEALHNFHLIANTFYGAGNGRYIGALGPDAIVKVDGSLSPIHSGSGIAGFEWQVTPRFEFDGYYSGAYFQRNFGGAVATSATPAPSCLGVSGFFCTGFGFPGSANTNNKSFQEASLGFTHTIWGSPTHGKLQFITQSSWVERTPWSVPTGSPRNAHAFMEYIDLRYVIP